MNRQVYYGGWYPIPPMTDKEQSDYNKGDHHKVRNSAHVQAMEQLINESHSVPPTEVIGAVFAFDGEDAIGANQAYVVIVEDEDTNDLMIQSCVFLGGYVHGDAIRRLMRMNEDQLLQERFVRTPPRSVLP